MRIYLACTVRGDRAGTAAGRIINDRLRHYGHEVLTTHLLADDVETAESTLSEADIFRRDLAWLSACDMLVAEASGSSYGVGFEVGFIAGRAQVTGQRVLLLYNQARRQAVSRLIVGNTDPSCTTVAYGSLEDLAAIVDRYCQADSE